MLKQIKIGQRGEQHIRQKLATSANRKPSLPIANAIFQANIVSMGQIYAIAEATSGCNLNDFKVTCGDGGKDVAELLSKWIWDFIHISPAHICLIDEPLSEPDDVNWRSEMLPPFADVVRLSSGSIFYYVSSKSMSESKEKILELVQSAFWYPSYYAFVVDSAEILGTQPAGAEVSEDDLLKVAIHTHGFVTDAYDLEGLLLWTRLHSSTLDNPFH